MAEVPLTIFCWLTLSDVPAPDWSVFRRSFTPRAASGRADDFHFDL